MAFRLILFLLPLTLFAKTPFEEPWGKDADLKPHSSSLQHSPPPPSIAARAMLGLIYIHQNFFSPTQGPRSNFRPSSSEYMRQAIHKYGFFKGYVMGCDRLMRENDAEWVYRKVLEEDKLFKSDPP